MKPPCCWFFVGWNPVSFDISQNPKENIERKFSARLVDSFSFKMKGGQKFFGLNGELEAGVLFGIFMGTLNN